MHVVKKSPPVIERLLIKRINTIIAKNTDKQIAAIAMVMLIGEIVSSPSPPPPRSSHNINMARTANKMNSQKYIRVVTRVLGFSFSIFSIASEYVMSLHFLSLRMDYFVQMY